MDWIAFSKTCLSLSGAGRHLGMAREVVVLGMVALLSEWGRTDTSVYPTASARKCCRNLGVFQPGGDFRLVIARRAAPKQSPRRRPGDCFVHPWPGLRDPFVSRSDRTPARALSAS